MTQPYYLDVNDTNGLINILDSSNLLNRTGKFINAYVLSGGNMNYVIRIEGERDSVIFKQGRPWVEKYPSIAAPWGRCGVEAAYYQQTSHNEFLKKHHPQVFYFDQETQILAMEDLGDMQSLGTIYGDPSSLEHRSIIKLLQYLDHLHSIKIEDTIKKTFINLPMKKLNHFHIFIAPFAETEALALDSICNGLSDLRKKMLFQKPVKSNAIELGEWFLETGPTLLHGDFYPGSWMSSDDELIILDPEFSFMGYREFDYGILLGHLALASKQLNLDKIEQELRLIEGLDLSKTYRVAGVEILRRIFGVAQLPTTSNLATLERKVTIATEWLFG